MMNATPASIAALNGTNSTARSRSGECSTIGSSTCESVAVSPCPRKMLAAGGDAGALQLLDDDASEARHNLGPLAERAIANDRIFGIRVNVEDRRVIERDADRRQLGRKRRCKPLRKRRIAASSEHRHRRPHGERRTQPRHAAAFLIDADPGWQLDAKDLRVVREPRHLLGPFDVPQASKQGDAAQIELPGERPHLDRDITAGETTNQQLTDTAAKRLRRHDLSL